MNHAKIHEIRKTRFRNDIEGIAKLIMSKMLLTCTREICFYGVNSGNLQIHEHAKVTEVRLDVYVSGILLICEVIYKRCTQ